MLTKPPELKPRAQQALRSQTITELTPGSLLHDFAALLDFVTTRELTATGKQQLLPLAALEELGLLDAQKATAIQQAAAEVADGKHDRHFPLDVFHAGLRFLQRQDRNAEGG